jgi:hypothetical protein
MSGCGFRGSFVVTECTRFRKPLSDEEAPAETFCYFSNVYAFRQVSLRCTDDGIVA